MVYKQPGRESSCTGSTKSACHREASRTGWDKGSLVRIHIHFIDVVVAVATRAPLCGYNGPANRCASMRCWRQRLPGAERAQQVAQGGRVW